MEDLTGRTFNRLTVVDFSHFDKRHVPLWNCKCVCGNETKVRGPMLKNNHTKSCGCYHREKLVNRILKHNLCGTPAYKTWNCMIQRCTNKNQKYYSIYGGRGITVCEKWLMFEGFYEDMGDRPDGMSLDRIDNNKGYFKENCRWVNQTEQANNTRTNVNITFQGKTQSLSKWSRELKISRSTLNNRLFRSKWSVEDAFKRSVNQ